MTSSYAAQGWITCCLLLSTSLVPMRTQADDAEKPEDPLVARMMKVAQSFEISEAESPRPLIMTRQPLLNWVNPSRESVQRGLVYVWERDGRPVVIGSAFSYVWSDERRIKMQLHSLSTSTLRATFDDQTVWTPKANAVEWKTGSDAPSPAADERRRLTQMRQIARQFRASITNRDGETTALRLLPQPLHRYKSPTHGIVDGAIFSFVVATDPDAYILIEAVEREGARHYRFAFARFHYITIHAEDSTGTSVWEAQADFSQINHRMGDRSHFEKPYVTFQVEAWPDGELIEENSRSTP